MAKDQPAPDEATRLTKVNGDPSGEVPYLIVLTGLSAGSIFRPNDDLTIGRDASAEIRLLDLDVSRRHARVVRAEDRILIEDLGSTNGTSVNGQRVQGRHELRDGDAISVGSTTMLKFTYHDGMDAGLRERLLDRAHRDSLTGVYKREYLDELLRVELSYARRHGSRLTLLLLDVDGLSALNEQWDRMNGDATLARIARRLEPHVRAEDVLARFGGGTFAVLCRGISHEQSMALGDRLRRCISRDPFPVVGNAILVSICVGIGSFPSSAVREPTDLVAAANRPLREAKKLGPNRIRVARTDGSDE